MWNRRELCPPPACSFKVTVTQKLKSKLLYVQGQLGNGKSDLASHLSVLSSEQYVQDRMIYKLSSQFRSEKSLKHMKQARICLNRLKELDLQRQLEDLIATFTVNVQEEECVYLPSKQMLQHYLVKLMSTAALLSRSCQLLQQTYFYAKQLMEIGNMLSQNLMLIAISARLWVTCKSLQSCVCVWYQALLPVLELLQPTPVPWLKSDNETEDILPANLSSWLQSQFDVESFKHDDIRMIQAVELKFSDDESEEESDMGKSDNQTFGMMAEDIGEPVQRKRKEKISEKTETAYQQSAAAEKEELLDRLSEDQSEHSEEHEKVDNGALQNKSAEVADQHLDKTRVKRHLENKLKNMKRIIKNLKIIKRKNPVWIGSYEFETTLELRQAVKHMLNSCKQFMKENPKESENLKKMKKSETTITAKFQKMLISKLLKLNWQYKPKLLINKGVDGCLERTTSTRQELNNEDSKVIDLCIENGADRESDSDECITGTKTLNTDEVIELGNIADSGERLNEKGNITKKNQNNKVTIKSKSANSDIRTIKQSLQMGSSKVKRKGDDNINKKHKKKKKKLLEKNIELTKIGSGGLDHVVEKSKSQNQDLDTSLPEVLKKAKKTGKKKKTKNLKNKSLVTAKHVEKSSVPESTFRLKRKQTADIKGPKKKKSRM